MGAIGTNAGHKLLAKSKENGTAWCEACGHVTWEKRQHKASGKGGWSHHADWRPTPPTEDKWWKHRDTDEYRENDDVFDCV